MKKPKIAWLGATVLTLTAAIALVGVPIYALMVGFDIWQISFMVVGVIFTELSITAGYHRLWTHRAYSAHWSVRLLLAFGGTLAVQNSILHWASDHRRHHRNVDDVDTDPYSAKRGFWYSHIGWMLREYNPNPDPTYSNCPDLKKDPIVMWQHRHYVPLALGINFGFPILIGYLHGDILGMMLLLGFTRLVIAHHFTFFINSLSHIWGSQPYSDKNSSRDNSFLAVLTMGEGYHNYHHSFQRDYRNGIRWWQFDPTKWLIRSFAWMGLANNLYRTPIDRIEKARATMMLTKTSEKLAALPHADMLLLRLHEEYDALIYKVNEFSAAKLQWIEAKKSSVLESYDLDNLKNKVELLKENFLQQKKNWQMLNAQFA